ncbi:MAG: prolipoprotein diacylglyceryl transferase [Chitinophagales bacterium]
MIPEMNIFGIAISWYWLLNIIGVSLGFCLLFPKLKQHFENKDMAVQVSVLLIMGGYVFAKLFSTMEYYIINAEPLNIEIFSFFLHKSGMRWYGALLGNLMMFSILFYKHSKFLSILSDIFLYTFLGSAIGKLGCLLSGHGCYGIETSLPWGMKFIYGSAPSEVSVHPTPAYDSIIFITAFIIGVFLKKKNVSKKVILLVTLSFLCFSEFAIEYLRPNPDVLLGLNTGQICYVLILLILYWMVIRKQRESAEPYSMISIQ